MRYKKSAEDWIIDSIAYIGMSLFAITALIPFLNVVAKSFSSNYAIISGKVGIFPKGFNLDSMKYVIISKQFQSSFRISIFLTVVATLFSVFIVVLTAYPLSKKHIRGIKPILLLFIFTMFFGGGMIPNYLLIKNLGWMDSLLPLIVPNALNVFNIILVKSYYESIPESLEESARLDGASNITILFRIVIPLSKPIIATILLFTAVGNWNSWFEAMLYINNSALKPLPLYLRDIIMLATSIEQPTNMDSIANFTAEGARAATIIVSTLPILLVYPFVQKYFISGIMIGSVKG